METRKRTERHHRRFSRLINLLPLHGTGNNIPGCWQESTAVNVRFQVWVEDSVHPLPVYLIGQEVQRTCWDPSHVPGLAAATNLNAAAVPPRVNAHLQTIMALGDVGGRESQTVLGGSLDPEREPCGLTNDHTVPAMNSGLWLRRCQRVSSASVTRGFLGSRQQPEQR